MNVVALLAGSFLLFLTFVVKKKRLPRLAILFCWMIAVFLKDGWFNIAVLNLKLVEVPPEMNKLFLRTFHFYILTPLIIVWAVDAAAGIRPIGRLFAGGVSVALLFAADAAFVAVGAWTNVGEGAGWRSLAESAAVYAVVAFVTGRFLRLLRKEGVVL